MEVSVEAMRAPANVNGVTANLLTYNGPWRDGPGAFWSNADMDYKAMRQWIAEGAKEN